MNPEPNENASREPHVHRGFRWLHRITRICFLYVLLFMLLIGTRVGTSSIAAWLGPDWFLFLLEYGLKISLPCFIVLFLDVILSTLVFPREGIRLLGEKKARPGDQNSEGAPRKELPMTLQLWLMRLVGVLVLLLGAGIVWANCFG